MHGWSHKPVRESKSIKKPQSPSFSSTLLDEIYRSMDASDDKLTRKQRVSDGGRIRASGAVEDSDSSLGYVSEPISFCESRSQKLSCFGPFGSKQVKTDVSLRKHQQTKNTNHTNNIIGGPFINSKARVLKIYTKVKQPISPGGRFTTFLNSLLTNRHLKKPKDLNEQKIQETSKSTHGSTCSFTKSCLSKNSPKSREKINNGIRRTVRFYPVSVIIDEDCRPCGEKFIYADQDFSNVHEAAMMSKNQFSIDDEESSNNDVTSDVSSDLFELDHLSILQECHELPIFETTHFDTECAVANG